MSRRSLFYIFLSCSVCTVLFVILTEYLFKENATSRISVRTDAYLYPPPWTLVDLRLTYLINNPVCHSLKTVFCLILITSHAGDTELRNQIRKVLPVTQLQRLNIARIFLIAKINYNDKTSSSKYNVITTTKELLEENEKYHDLVMGDFYESYKNLTYKHLMGLQWANRFCPHAQFIVKQDDDIIVDYYQLENILQSTTLGNQLLDSKYIAGKILKDMSVIRESSSKWFVSKSEYEKNVYPPFVSGWAYITTPKVTKEIVKAAEDHSYFWIDDIHVTGTLAELTGTKLSDVSPYFTIFKGQLHCCVATSSVNSKSTDNRPYWCDFLIGPSNDDLPFMELFFEHALFCHTAKVCMRRPANESLSRSCVVTNQMILNKNLPQYSQYIPSSKIKQVRGQWTRV